MSKEKQPYVCPAEYSGSLDNWLRRLIHKPAKILKPYVSNQMTVLDLGCGPGYFTGELARLVGDKGSVIAADLQQAMLDKVRLKIKGTDMEPRVKMHRCLEDKIGISEKVNLVLAFWMVHEVPDQTGLFKELRSLLNTGGRVWIIEPKIHVREAAFNKMIATAESEGFEVIERPKVSLSRTIMLSIR
jgi:ubiquinone/menaquinone biosynthesis C-methylase UbiE